MNVHFYKGTVRLRDGGKVPLYWAETARDSMAFQGDSMEPVEMPEVSAIVDSELITTVDLTGLDEAGIETVVRNIIMGGYLDKPGVKDKGEAVLFVLVNEAIHRLSELSNEAMDE